MSESTWKTLAEVKETAEAVSESAAAVELLCYKTAAASLFYKRRVEDDDKTLSPASLWSFSDTRFIKAGGR